MAHMGAPEDGNPSMVPRRILVLRKVEGKVQKRAYTIGTPQDSGNAPVFNADSPMVPCSEWEDFDGGSEFRRIDIDEIE